MAKENKKFNRTAPLFVKMSLMMALMAVIQLIVFFLVMVASGEIKLMRNYAYSFLTEKTDNRAAYIESYLNQCVSHVSSYAEAINRRTARILTTEGKDSDAFFTDKTINKQVLAENAELVVALSRSAAVNDAFIYLNTGDLYGENKYAGFYIRDMDVYSENTDNSDLLLEAGNAETARAMGITMDFEWSLYTDATVANDFGFFTEPIKAFSNGAAADVYDRGYWSGFSRISRSASESIKYTQPLMLSDGTVYGVIGIGLLEKSVMGRILTNDIFNDSACYILACDQNGDGIYTPEAHTGPAYVKLVGNETIFDSNVTDSYGMLTFTGTKIPAVGSVTDFKLYSSNSPFVNQRWALVSVAESEAIFEIHHKLINTFMISAGITFAVAVLISLFLTHIMTRPVSIMTRLLNKVSGSGEIIRFPNTSVTEFNTLATAIEELQVNVRKQASRVSEILSLSESGIGTFMYDRNSDSVFVGKSLPDILNIKGVDDAEDFTVSFEEFRKYLGYFDEHYKIFDNDVFSVVESDTKQALNIDTEYVSEDEEKKWFRFSFTKDENMVMGLVQDITEEVRERRKIEHERDYDVTTDIYNRRAFYRRVDALFSEPEKLGVSAFLMMDLDNLKFVNDTFGHEYGDRYIKAAADALKTLVPKNGVVARLSGDEFIAFIYGGANKDDIRAVIEEFKQTLDKSSCTLSDGSQYKVRASGGISWYPENSQDYAQLIKYADFSMYTIKHSTKGVFAEFNESSYLNDSILITGIQELNRIIDSGDIKFAFQPIIRVRTGEIFGYEALMCPHSETITSISELLRIAKSGAKLYEIERLTFFLGISSFSRLVESGKIADDAHLFLNSISECMLDQRSFNGIQENYPTIVKNIVLENLDVDQHDNELIEKKQEIVSRWGGMTALDNFGRGHNNESTLFSINPDMIIIDRDIVSGCDQDHGKLTVIKNLVHLTRERGVLVVAQGIENDAELHVVISLGVDLVQGYYLANPEYDPQSVDSEILMKIAKYRAEYEMSIGDGE